MRLVVMLASVAVAVGLAVPAQADPDSDASFLAALKTAGITLKAGLMPRESAAGRAS